jgi:SOS-response transcriptional repressor LexA
MAGPGAFSWNSELPSGHNPFWIRDDGLSGLGLRPGDAVSVDTRADPQDGDLVVAEAEIDGDSQRLARRYFASSARVRLEAVSDDPDDGTYELDADQVIVMGVIKARVRFDASSGQPIEEPLLLA